MTAPNEQQGCLVGVTLKSQRAALLSTGCCFFYFTAFRDVAASRACEETRHHEFRRRIAVWHDVVCYKLVLPACAAQGPVLNNVQGSIWLHAVLCPGLMQAVGRAVFPERL
jgi:hypothetical protein